MSGQLGKTAAVVGPTAVGKTALAVELCRRTGGEIVSIDSRQAYRGIEIASNAPVEEELGDVRCHLVGMLEPYQGIDAASYAVMARNSITDIQSRGRTPVLTAGTGLYLKALLDGLDLGGVAPQRSLRRELQELAEGDLPALMDRLRQVDPEGAGRIDEHNPRRVVRRLEIVLLKEAGPEALPWNAIPAVKIGLTAPRSVLYQWIEERVDRMLQRGLVDEVNGLLSRGVTGNRRISEGIGIKEIAAHLNGEISLDGARAAIIQRSRRYAKQQWTWFRADPEVKWHDMTVEKRSDIVEAILGMLCS